MENKEETIAQKAMRILKDISSDKFIVNNFTNGIDACCVIGHYQRLTSSNPSDYSRSNCSDFYDITPFSSLRMESLKYGIDIATVNNKKTARYQQDTSKERVIAALKNIIIAGDSITYPAGY